MGNCSARLSGFRGKQFCGSSSGHFILALGANKNGRFGTPMESLREAIERLAKRGIFVVRVSSPYRTRPIGGGRQNTYFNAVVFAVASIPPAQALRIMKRIEREAGRRQVGRNRPRPLDLDIVAVGGRIIGWPKTPRHEQRSADLRKRIRSGPRSRSRGWLTVPHPLMDQRNFVLVPLVEIAPHWRHPVLGVEARRLLARLHWRGGDVQLVVDPEWVLWHNTIVDRT